MKTKVNRPEVVVWYATPSLHCLPKQPGVRVLEELEDFEVLGAELKDTIAILILHKGDEAVLNAIELLRRAQDSTSILMALEAGQGEFLAQALKAGLDDYLYIESNLILTAMLLDQKIERLLRARNERHALKSADTRWDTFFGNSPVGIKLVDSQGVIVQTNKALQEFLGYDELSMIGRTCQDFIHTEDLPRCAASFQEIFAGKRDIIWTRKRFYHRDGSTRWGEFACMTIRDEQGEPREFIQMVVDISSHRHLEEHCQRTDKLMAMGRMAGGIAHDFNNLLAIISSDAFLLLESLETSPTDSATIHRIMHTANRGGELTRQLMSFGRRKSSYPELIDLKDFLDSMEALISSLLGQGIDLELLLSDNLRPVHFDRHELEQVIVNLVINARDAMPDGGRLRIIARCLRHEELRTSPLGHRRHDEVLVLEVQDTGMGIEPPLQEKIFEPFFSTKPAHKGSGLGLATVFGIVSDHDGYIQVQSKLEQGTTFSISLPGVADSIARLSRPSNEYRPCPGHPRARVVLVLIEDNESHALVVNNLRQQQFEVLEATCADDVRAVASDYRGRIDFFLVESSDGNMSARLARELALARPGIKNILCTANVAQDKTVLPFHAYLNNPVELSALSAILAEISPMQSGVLRGGNKLLRRSHQTPV